MTSKIHEWINRHIVSRFSGRYTRALEAELARLRAENRALVNSILGLAGIPPMRIAAAAQNHAVIPNPVAPVPAPHARANGRANGGEGSAFSFRLAAPKWRRMKNSLRHAQHAAPADSQPRALAQRKSPYRAVRATSWLEAFLQSVRSPLFSECGGSTPLCRESHANSEEMPRSARLAQFTPPHGGEAPPRSLRRRSWQQIGRALEFHDALAARRERASDTETFPPPRNVIPRV